MGFNMKVTPEIEALTKICEDHSKMDVSLYAKYDVKRGLRDINGKGVLAGLTQISNIVSNKEEDGKSVPCDGELYYRGINIEELTKGFYRKSVLDLKKLHTCCYSERCQHRSSWTISARFLEIRDACRGILSAMLL